jgi:transposase
VNVLKSHLRITIETLLSGGATQREIARRTGVDRKTIRRVAAANSPGVATGSDADPDQTPPPRPPAPAAAKTESACEAHRAWIETQVGLGRNAVSIYQDLVESHGFAHRYNAVKRFVARLKARAPERFDVLEFLPGEEAQVDYGQGAPTLTANGKYKRPYLFVMTLKFSGKSFRTTVWKTSQEGSVNLPSRLARNLVKAVEADNRMGRLIRSRAADPQSHAIVRSVGA